MPDQAEEFTCAYGIDGMQAKPIRKRAHGIDAFQALMLAMRSVRLYLEDFHEETGQELYWLDQSEFHGFEDVVRPEVS